MFEEGKSPSSDPRLDVLDSCAVLHLHVCYVIKPADPKNASQASHVECLQAIYITLEQGPGFRTTQEYGEDTRIVEAKLGDEAEISLSTLDRAGSWPTLRALCRGIPWARCDRW